MDGSKMVLMVIFVILSMSIITYMPEGLYNTGYQQTQTDIPSEFIAWTKVGSDYAILDELNKGERTVYDFTSHMNETLKFRMDWGILSNDIEVWEITSYWTFGYNKWLMSPIITKNILIANWIEEYNASLLLITNGGNVEGYFQDYNATRNNIESAWDDGKMNCTLAISKGYEESEYIGAREILVALLTFRIPSIFPSINPLLGIVFSMIIYIPIAFIFFYIIIDSIHGR